MEFRANHNAATVAVSSNGVSVNRVFLKLASAEQKFLAYLSTGCGMCRTHAMLEKNVFGGNPGYNRSANLVRTIRKKLDGLHPDAGGVIRTVRGRGYAFGVPERKAVIREGCTLPSPDMKWKTVTKKGVAQVLMLGKVSREYILSRYPDVSSEELDEWISLHGLKSRLADTASFLDEGWYDWSTYPFESETTEVKKTPIKRVA